MYKTWFVDFIPFNKTIPLDWKEILFSDIAEFINGYSYKGKELSTSNTAMATIKNFSRNGTFNVDGYKEIIISEKVKSEHYLEKFDILVAHTDLTQNADIIGNAEMIFNKLNYQDIVFSMDLVKVIPKNKNISKFLLILLLKNPNFKNHCLGYVNGTTVLHLSKKALQEYKVFLPENLDILNPLLELISKIYEKLSLLSKENEKLINLKNYLLPKLMNGEIDIENIEI